ncbi:hypothetical protein HMPREF9555_00444 [Selenomonas artemidis F0399]|uniref:Uncharacterized protein n=1 Tax=Selenomonas artemidis F0399 TaxID=749551 RepID=E7N0E4_9FIRM|nr:hypothetical protein HMPREF9555_00444 [Selenomonas artemidis F0399]
MLSRYDTFIPARRNRTNMTEGEIELLAERTKPPCAARRCVAYSHAIGGLI